MDPNTTRQKMVALAERLGAFSEDDMTCELAELVLALNDWLINGGYLPVAWQR